MIMLPYFKTVDEVRIFVELVNGRARTFPLVETPEAVDAIDEILRMDGVDELHVGLNDLSLGLGRKFMFELLADGTIERLSRKFRDSQQELRLEQTSMEDTFLLTLLNVNQD